MRPPRIGCSGWNYKSWRGRFYPPTLPAARWLDYYARAFDTVEVNNTFYRLPERKTFALWQRQTPPGFCIAVKASRFLTHVKRLKEPDEPIARLFSRARALGPRLGPVLYQLPPNFFRNDVNVERLGAFLHALPRRVGGRVVHHVFEFRHPSWYVEETYDLLARHTATLCLHDKRGSAVFEPVVGPVVYVRFHGTTGHYAGSYPDRRLEQWASILAERWRDGRQVYAYFNNDIDGAAVRNAETLRARLADAL
ncbi:MAG TPA: DUF72 domain-containing protein [Vicinamibacterales bacterium]|nr:DUF72 domain-containing protein [Vicinamibacterales bacterium]